MAERIAIVTDSTCDLPQEVLESEGIFSVPLSIYFGEEEILDNLTLSIEKFYEKLNQNRIHPTTSQPPLGKFLALFEQLEKDGYTHVLCLHITRKFSGTVQSASVAANMVRGMRIQVIDSKTTTGALGMLVQYANQLVKNGLKFDDVLEKVMIQIPQTVIIFSVDNLEALQRGGRIGKARALIGKVLGIRPVLTLSGLIGEIEVVEKTRSVEDACRLMADKARRHVEKIGVHCGVMVLTAAETSYGTKLEKAMTDTGADFGKISYGKIGGVIGTHLGTTGWGIAIC